VPLHIRGGPFLVDAHNPYRYLEIRGDVRCIAPDPGKALIDSMAKKYMHQVTYPSSPPGESASS
jgi:hypothetical protein